jgi:phenylalanyl-tRNA synthetase alpha subunit
VQRVQKWVDIHCDGRTFRQVDQGHVNTAQVEELILEKQDTVQDLSTAMELSVKTVHSTTGEELGYSRTFKFIVCGGDPKIFVHSDNVPLPQFV